MTQMSSPHISQVRKILTALLTESPDSSWSLFEKTEIMQWLLKNEMGPLAYYRTQGHIPEQLRQRYHIDTISSLGESQLHLKNFDLIKQMLIDQDIQGVVLKGGAFAHTLYKRPAERPMSDLDIWILPKDMPQAIDHLCQTGFTIQSKSARPLALQEMSGGEIQLMRSKWKSAFVELHYTPIGGWWLKRTAKLDINGMWERRQSFSSTPNLYSFTPEDHILHLAIHLGVTHRFSEAVIRGLFDLALLIDQNTIDWESVIQRAVDWHIEKVVITTFYLLQSLIDVPSLPPDILTRFPSHNTVGARFLQFYIPLTAVIDQFDYRLQSYHKYMVGLLLIDRPRDRVKLIGRTLFPEPEWRHARYGRPTSQRKHLYRLIRYRRI